MEVVVVMRIIFAAGIVWDVYASETGVRPITVWMLVLAWAWIDISIGVSTMFVSRQSEKQHQRLLDALVNISEHLSEKLDRLVTADLP